MRGGQLYGMASVHAVAFHLFVQFLMCGNALHLQYRIYRISFTRDSGWYEILKSLEIMLLIKLTDTSFLITVMSH